MVELPVSIVDLEDASLGLVVRPGDVHGLPPRRDRIRHLLGLFRARGARRLRAAADRDPLDIDAQVRVERCGLRNRRRTTERHGDRVCTTAAAVFTSTNCARERYSRERVFSVKENATHFS